MPFPIKKKKTGDLKPYWPFLMDRKSAWVQAAANDGNWAKLWKACRPALEKEILAAEKAEKREA